MSKRAVILVLIVILGTQILGAQTLERGPERFGRPRSFDVKHYRIRISLDRADKAIIGSTVVSLAPLSDGFSKFSLDAEGLRFSSVTMEDSKQPLAFSVGAGSITVMLPKQYEAGRTLSVRFDYTARPKKGVYFQNEQRSGGKVVRGAQVWTQGEPEETRYWIPSYDFPDDKATSEQFVTAGPEETVISNGELQGIYDNGDGSKTFHHKMSIPHSTYLISFVIGKYAKSEDSFRGIPLGFYLYPGQTNVARKVFSKTKEMMNAFEAITGIPYPFNKYDQAIVANFNFGGMENITATTLSDQDVYLAETPLGQELVEDLVSHELAHSWFGNLVTCSNWAELWLNEGLATFMEAAWRERAYGRESYLAKLKADTAEFFFSDARNSKKHGLYNLLAKPDDSLFDSTTYKKGGAVVHMLRETVGDEVFWRAVARYLRRHSFSNVTSDDLRAAFEEESGKDLGWFFDQWVYGVGFPKLRIHPVYNAKAGTLTIKVAQIQKSAPLTPTVFRIPMDLTVTTREGRKPLRMMLTKRIQSESFPISSIPTSIDVDPEFRVPMKLVDIRPITRR